MVEVPKFTDIFEAFAAQIKSDRALSARQSIDKMFDYYPKSDLDEIAKLIDDTSQGRPTNDLELYAPAVFAMDSAAHDADNDSYHTCLQFLLWYRVQMMS